MQMRYGERLSMKIRTVAKGKHTCYQLIAVLSLYHSYYSIYDGISIFRVFASQHWTVAKETKEIIHWLDISSPKLTHSVETTFEMFSNHNLPIQYE